LFIYILFCKQFLICFFCHKMDFSASEESENELHESDLFMDLISNNPIVLEKSQLPVVKEKKMVAYRKIQEVMFSSSGKKYDLKLISKKISNTKTRLRRKADINRTGNKPVKLKEKEKIVLKLMDSENNPVFQKPSGMVRKQ
jgi:hypothetical protein